MQNILERNPEEICKDILNQVGNNEVRIELDESSKTSLYVFLSNTIYISTKKVKTKKSIEEQNKSKLLVIAHECAHSIQPKILQLANFILANLELLLFIALIFVRFVVKYESPILTYTYVGTVITSMIIRLFLEMDATIKSIKIVAKYMLNNNIEKKHVIGMIKYYKKKLLKTLPLFIINLFVFKIVRLIIALIR